MKVRTVTNPVDSLALASIAAMGITDDTQKAAITVAITQARGLGILSKIKAFYGFVGGTATTNKYNMFDTTKYTLIFNGGWVHAATGSLPNGSTGYAQTGLIPSVDLSSGNGIAFYSGTDNITGGGGIDMGVYGGVSGSQLWLSAGYSSSNDNFLGNNTDLTTGQQGNLNGNSKGFYLTNNDGANNFLDKNGVQFQTAANVPVLQTKEVYLGSLNNGGSLGFPSNRELRTAVIFNGLTPQERVWLEQIVYEFNYSLSRAFSKYNWFFGDSFTYGVYAGRTLTNNWVALLDTALGQTCINNGKSGQAITQNRVIGNSIDKTTIPQKSIRDNKLVFAYCGYNEYLAALTVAPFTNTIANMQADYATLINYAVSNRGWSYSDIVGIHGYYIAPADPDQIPVYLWMDGLNATALSLGCKVIDNRAYEAANGGNTLVISAVPTYNEHPNAVAQPVLSTNIAANW